VRTGFWGGNPGARGRVEDRSVHGRVILKRIFMRCDGEALIGLDLVQDRDRWRSYVMSLRVP
jgi:hypothetical protein